MPRRSANKLNLLQSQLIWPPDTELVGLEFELVCEKDAYLYPQYAIGLHAWFLNQVRSTDPELSAYLHDGESEKPFSISALEGAIASSGRQVQLLKDTSSH
jgi:CRISPR-associated endoribonuclease Cas6